MEKLTLLQDTGRSTIQVMNERGDDFWIPRTDKRAVALLAAEAAGAISVETKILNLHPSTLSNPFLAYLSRFGHQVEIRIHFPKHAEGAVHALFSREGIDLPSDIRPIESGKRGGHTVQRSLAGEMWFPTPDAGLQTPDRKDDLATGISKISSLEVILAALKSGLRITKYTHTPAV